MIRALAKQRNSGWRKLIGILWSWVLPVAIFLVIGLKFTSHSENLSMLKSVELVNVVGVVFCLLLLPLNVGLEAWKWQCVLKPMEQQSIWSCLKIILAGKGLNVVSPFGLGDGLSRYMGLSPANKNQIIAGLAIDRFSQLLPTVGFGVLSVFFLLEHGLNIPMNELFIVLALMFLMVVFVMLGFYFFRNHIQKYLALFSLLDYKSIFRIGSLSFVRYSVFTIQFYLIFWALGSQLSLSITLLGVAWIFLFKTLIPNMSVLGDLMKREVSATLFFSFFISDLSVVIMASFLVWMINIVLPALVGVLFVSDLKKSF